MSDTIFEKESKYFFHTFHRLPLEIDRGEGVYLYSKEGKRYLDFFSGLAVNPLGYNHPSVNEAIEKQIHRYIHLSNYYVQEKTVELAERILSATGYQRIFFSNSGTEAVEGALKIVRKWGHGSKRTTILNLTNSFHGRTMGALSLTERPKYRDGYDPFLPNTNSVTFNDVGDLRAKVNEQTLGLILEFIQGEGGINVVSSEFALELKSLKEKYGFLLIADEIQSGIGRTGKFFGFEQYDIRPDIVVIAKAIGGGLPLGAILGNEKVAEVLTYGTHGTTFGGNPVACAAGCAVMEEIVNKGLMKRAGVIGGYIKSKAMELQKQFPAVIKEVRGFGCMLGIDLHREGQSIVDELMNRGVLINCTNVTVLRLLPPYIVTEQQCDQLMFELHSILKSLK
ncbi:MAG: aspartate aminotransferase family protein [Ignavibacteriae bacterium]|nr:MAG: aspartate aminotransferase family protein [Ignavibacteriota bacterium]